MIVFTIYCKTTKCIQYKFIMNNLKSSYLDKTKLQQTFYAIPKQMKDWE